MGLPPQLEVFAENIWMRFPEVFVCLGSPQLDAQCKGVWSHRIADNFEHKAVEVYMYKRAGDSTCYLQSESAPRTQSSPGSEVSAVKSFQHAEMPASHEEPEITEEVKPISGKGSEMQDAGAPGGLPLAARRGLRLVRLHTQRPVPRATDIRRTPHLDRKYHCSDEDAADDLPYGTSSWPLDAPTSRQHQLMLYGNEGSQASGTPLPQDDLPFVSPFHSWPLDALAAREPLPAFREGDPIMPRTDQTVLEAASPGTLIQCYAERRRLGTEQVRPCSRKATLP
mmetsp:Transcript_21850/g.49793  ORF Transcript_21850/g.49793 Transcript_21850/m.49793 type:complete len:282 (+) Transcript_21850:76-921(+)